MRRVSDIGKGDNIPKMSKTKRVGSPIAPPTIIESSTDLGPFGVEVADTVDVGSEDVDDDVPFWLCGLEEFLNVDCCCRIEQETDRCFSVNGVSRR